METQLEMTTRNALREQALGHYLGPATIVEQAGSGYRVEHPDGFSIASLALGYPYRPEPGDRVLVIGINPSFVIGVLKTKGRTQLNVTGDLEITATGKLRLRGGKELQLETDRMKIRSRTLDLSIDKVTERINNCYRWVKGVIQTVAGRTRTIVEKNATLHAGRIVEKAKGDVVLDGKQIRLG
jgi:hypothetical protein